MGYQALLFCPDEKTARTVTQVLNELDFTVEPCTEPFAAVKKLMSQVKQRFPEDVDYAISLDQTLPVTEGMKEIIETLLIAIVLVILVV